MAEEKNLENKVKKYLESKGIYNFGTPNHKIKAEISGYWEKRWGGGQFSKSGLPDMQIVINGRCIEVELKASNGKPSALQIKNLYLINRSGGDGFIVIPTNDDAIRLKKWVDSKYSNESAFIRVISFENFKVFIANLLTISLT